MALVALGRTWEFNKSHRPIYLSNTLQAQVAIMKSIKLVLQLSLYEGLRDQQDIQLGICYIYIYMY